MIDRIAIPVFKTALTLLVVLSLGACRGLKYSSVEHPLFASYSVAFTESPESSAGAAQSELEKVVIPKPNTSIFGMRPTVALYNMTKEPKRKGKGLRNLLKYKIGSAPVQLDDVPLNDIDAALVNRMRNRGYFSASATHVVKAHKRTAKVEFTVYPGPVHRIRTIAYSDTTLLQPDTLLLRIARMQKDSPIKAGDPYSLVLFVSERERIASNLRNTGYYDFRNDHLEFAVDSSVGNNEVDVLLRLKADMDPDMRQRYRLGAIHVLGDHDDLLQPSDTVVVDSLYYVNYLGMYRPSTITRGVFLQPGQLYSERRTALTQQYLSSYGAFRSVRIDFKKDSVPTGMLATTVTLSPLKRFSLFTELNATSKSNNFAGPGIKIGFKDRDIFRGAELLTIDLNGRFETQISGANKGTNAYEIGIKGALSFPRLLFLGKLKTARSRTPTTHVEIGYGLFRRLGLYGLESTYGGYSYVWQKNSRVWHDLKLLDVSYNNLYYASPDFDAFLNVNPSIRKSFNEQFIVGTGYTYTRSSQRGKADLSWWLMSIGVDEGGNLPSVIFRLADGARPDSGYTILGERFAQFARIRPELRFFQRIGNNGGQLAARLLASAAFPFGNSSTVPYVKQFYSGGTNSLRAFRARGIGPGTYNPRQNASSSSNLLIDQVGDIKFEANLEYRWTISGPLKGAFFADAGNVWLLNDDPQRPGGQFKLNKALDQLAIGAGAGLRFDPEVIVIRLDLATPLRRPDLARGDRWVFDDQYPKLSDNFILNIAIGYPF